MAWTREFDTKYQTHYWYDSKTGESSWTEPPGWSEPSVEAENPETDRLTNKDDELELVLCSAPLFLADAAAFGVRQQCLHRTVYRALSGSAVPSTS